jgi:hypothetical protein
MLGPVQVLAGRWHVPAPGHAAQDGKCLREFVPSPDQRSHKAAV